MVLVIFSLFVVLAATNLKGVISKHSFKGRIQSFVSALESAATAAAQTGRRYEVIIDITEQTYLLREITTSDLSQIFEDEVIFEGDFGNNCWATYVLFADGDFTNEGRAKFRAGRHGWEWAGVITFLDRDDRMYSVVVNQLNNIVTVQAGEAEILWPKSSEEMAF